MSLDKENQTFKSKEGDAWFERNIADIKIKAPDNDPIFLSIKTLLKKMGRDGYKDCNILEVGCSSGYRLEWMKNEGANVTGFDPSKRAISYGIDTYNMNSSELFAMNAREFFEQNSKTFEIVLFSHCLYLLPPSDLPIIVSGCMDNLDVGGFICIYDFDSPAQRQKYHHAENIWSYKMEYDKLFTSFPQMKLISKNIFEHDQTSSVGNPKEDCALSIIRKINLEYAYPVIKGNIKI